MGGQSSQIRNTGATPDRLLPRKSFDAWKQTVRGRSIAWTPAELDAALDLRVSLLQIILRRIEFGRASAPGPMIGTN